jgi:hypothetical protein
LPGFPVGNHREEILGRIPKIRNSRLRTLHSLWLGITGEGYQEVVAALGTSGTGEAVSEDAALQVAAELPLHVPWPPLSLPVVSPCQGEVGLQMLLDDVVERCVLRMATSVRNGSTSL